MSRPPLVDLARLDDAVARGRDAYASAVPFPHLVVDGLCDPAALRAVVAEFAHADAAWTYWHHVNERKRGLSDRARMGPASGALVDALQTPAVVRALERLTGVAGLVADPALDGGGLHETLPGGFLNVHADFLAHPLRPTWRREVNLLLFLNEDWAPVHGGWLELWDPGVARCVTRVAPTFNRCVVFRTTEASYHGVPEAVACPPGGSRKSLALYYFRDVGHVLRVQPTRYRPRPDDGPLRRALIRADGAALRAYAWLKRYTPLGDRVVSRLLRRL